MLYEYCINTCYVYILIHIPHFILQDFGNLLTSYWYRGAIQPFKSIMKRSERRCIPLNYAQPINTSDKRRASANPPSPTIPLSQNIENPYYNRSRTADNFAGPGVVHSGPAVFRSTLTSSATMNDLGKSAAINFQSYRITANNDRFSQSNFKIQ